MSDLVVIKRANGGLVEVQCTVSDRPRVEVEVTDHPVADGANPTDHARLKPVTLSLEGVFSQASLEADDVTAAERMEALWAILLARETVTVYAPRRTYELMMPTSLEEPRDGKSGAGRRFSMTLKQIRVVATAEVALPTYASDAARKGDKKKSLGDKTGKQVPKAELNQTAGKMLTDVVNWTKPGDGVNL
jgi:hypothetical protein